MPDPKDMWNRVYGEDHYAYGEAPNDFLAAHVDKLPANGKVLCLAEGEGRNGVFLAEQGHDVTGVDISEAGQKKALALADKRGVRLDYVLEDLATFDLGDARYDAIVSVFCHGPAPLRVPLHEKVVRALKPGGVFLLEAYTPEQVGRGTGGPPIPEMMHSKAQLEVELHGLVFDHLVELERDVIEGKKHTGTASVVQCLAHKPS